MPDPTPEKPESPHIWFLLDRSGSMQALYQDVVLGLQEFIREQRLADPRARLTLVQFDSEDAHDVILDGKRLAKVDEARATNRFEPRAATPLYDAIAALVDRADRHVVKGGDDADQIVVIFTDGFENASTHCNRTKAFELIKKRRERDWTFVFMGANQDSYEAGEALAIDRGNARNWSATSAGTRDGLDAASKGVTRQMLRPRDMRREYKDRFFEEEE
jgi:Mg-chelatase subunit ChlD